MKNILILTAFALGSLAAAQDTTPAPAPAPADTTPAAPADTATPAAPADTTPAAPADTAAPATAAPATAAPAMMNMASMSPAENFAKAQEYATQADVAYPVSFYDRTLWKAAVDSAYYASAGEAGNRAYMAYLGQLYTKTQWWINAYNVWTKMTDLTDNEKDWAALSAAKLAYIAYNRGDTATARTYVTTGMAWKNTASLQALMTRLQ